MNRSALEDRVWTSNLILGVLTINFYYHYSHVKKKGKGNVSYILTITHHLANQTALLNSFSPSHVSKVNSQGKIIGTTQSNK